MSVVVLMDGQWSMVRPLRPFPNFERIYQGKDGSIPVAFPGDLDLFARRGEAGYDPNLLGAVTVPLGANVTLWIPMTIAGYAVNANYRYQILWRYRTLRDYLTGQAQGQVTPVQSYSSYHVGPTSSGQPEVNTMPKVAGNARFFIPGASQTAATREDEPSDGTASVITLRGELLDPVIDPVWTQPLTPSGQNGTWQQGVYIGSSQANTGGPSWVTYTLKARGDEMAILAYKKPGGEGPPADWDFTQSGDGFDLSFSNTYGNGNGQNQIGPTAILVTTGTD